MRFAEGISLTKAEALDILQTMHLAAVALSDADLMVEAVQAQELIELIEDRLTPGE